MAPLPKFMIEKCGYEEFRLEMSGVEMSRFEKFGNETPSNFNPNRGAILCKTDKTAVLPRFWEIDWAGQCYGGLA